MFLKSRRRTNLTRSDGYFYFDGDSEPFKVQVREWYNIGVVGEYKKKRSVEDIHDVSLQCTRAPRTEAAPESPQDALGYAQCYA